MYIEQEKIEHFKGGIKKLEIELQKLKSIEKQYREIAKFVWETPKLNAFEKNRVVLDLESEGKEHFDLFVKIDDIAKKGFDGTLHKSGVRSVYSNVNLFPFISSLKSNLTNEELDFDTVFDFYNTILNKGRKHIIEILRSNSLRIAENAKLLGFIIEILIKKSMDFGEPEKTANILVNIANCSGCGENQIEAIADFLINNTEYTIELIDKNFAGIGNNQRLMKAIFEKAINSSQLNGTSELLIRIASHIECDENQIEAIASFLINNAEYTMGLMDENIANIGSNKRLLDTISKKIMEEINNLTVISNDRSEEDNLLLNNISELLLHLVYCEGCDSKIKSDIALFNRQNAFMNADIVFYFNPGIYGHCKSFKEIDKLRKLKDFSNEEIKDLIIRNKCYQQPSTLTMLYNETLERYTNLSRQAESYQKSEAKKEILSVLAAIYKFAPVEQVIINPNTGEYLGSVRKQAIEEVLMPEDFEKIKSGKYMKH